MAQCKQCPLGNLAAFFQTSVKRLLAYSTISQAGYLLMALAVADRTDIAQRGLLYYWPATPLAISARSQSSRSSRMPATSRTTAAWPAHTPARPPCSSSAC
jgi:Proton-conducting membrane transporter